MKCLLQGGRWKRAPLFHKIFLGFIERPPCHYLAPPVVNTPSVLGSGHEGTLYHMSYIGYKPMIGFEPMTFPLDLLYHWATWPEDHDWIWTSDLAPWCQLPFYLYSTLRFTRGANVIPRYVDSWFCWSTVFNLRQVKINICLVFFKVWHTLVYHTPIHLSKGNINTKKTNNPASLPATALASRSSCSE